MRNDSLIYVFGTVVDNVDGLEGKPLNRNGDVTDGIVVVALVTIFVVGIRRVVIANGLVFIVADAIDLRALSDGGRLGIDDG